jgi:sigma-B regulation protein RsbU (phosphoserine phosphatase)
MTALLAQAQIRASLLDRRGWLATMIEQHPTKTYLQELLIEIDTALDRLTTENYGTCEICQEQIEEHQLLVDPLRKRCIVHLPVHQSKAVPDELAEFKLAFRAAHGLQLRMLPKSHLRLDAWELYFEYQAAGPVGGDYCDFIHRKTGELLLFFGDVMGKGFAASKISSQLNGVMRTLVDFELPLEALAERGNRIFCERVEAVGYYATLICACATPSGTIELVNAGHLPPLLIRQSATERLMATGVPIGLFHGSKYEVTRLHLAPGETLLFYTDGITEARDGSDSEYGHERLARLATSQSHLSPTQLVQACRDDVSQFSSEGQISDDVTVLALRRI